MKPPSSLTLDRRAAVGGMPGSPAAFGWVLDAERVSWLLPHLRAAMPA